MKAIRFTAVKEPLEVQEVDMPRLEEPERDRLGFGPVSAHE